MTPSEVALKYIGQTEKPGNMGFNNVEFEAKMKAVGFQPTHSWCAYLMELVFKEAYPERFKELDKLFSASAVQTWKNFVNAGHLQGELPARDWLVVWQNYKDGKAQWTGHIGVVTKVNPDGTFESVEGNTNDKGGREGYIVAVKKRTVNRGTTNGLRLLGFVRV